MITPTYIRCLWPVKFSLPTLHIPLSLQSPKTLFQSPRLKKQLLWFLTKYWEQGRGWFVVVSSPLHILGWSHLYPIKWWREAYTVMIVVLLWVWLFATHLIFFELRVNLCTHTHTHTHHAHRACRKKKTRRPRQQHEEQDRSVVGFCQPQPTIFTSQKTWSKKEEVGHKK